MEDVGGTLQIVRELGSLGLLALVLVLLGRGGFFRRGGKDDEGFAAAEVIAWLWFSAILAITLLSFAQRARPQEPANIARPFDGQTVHSTWPTSTLRLECDTPGMAATRVAGVEIQGAEPDPPEVTLPLAFPALEVRCRACNDVGCSALSPNALEISARARADCNADSLINVSDIVCVGVAIYRGGP